MDRGVACEAPARWGPVPLRLAAHGADLSRAEGRVRVRPDPGDRGRDLHRIPCFRAGKPAQDRAPVGVPLLVRDRGRGDSRPDGRPVHGHLPVPGGPSPRCKNPSWSRPESPSCLWRRSTVFGPRPSRSSWTSTGSSQRMCWVLSWTPFRCLNGTRRSKRSSCTCTGLGSGLVSEEDEEGARQEASQAVLEVRELPAPRPAQEDSLARAPGRVHPRVRELRLGGRLRARDEEGRCGGSGSPRDPQGAEGARGTPTSRLPPDAKGPLARCTLTLTGEM